MKDSPDLTVIRSEAHLSVMHEAARAGMQIVRGKSGVLPLPENAKIVLIEFASYHDSEVFDATGHTNFAGLFAARWPNATIIALPQPTPDLNLQQAMPPRAGRYHDHGDALGTSEP